MPDSDVKERVSRVLDMGFSKGSKILVHAFHTVCCINRETFERKMKLFQSFGFSEGECIKMFRKALVLFRTSEGKLRSRIEFFMNRMKFDKAVLVSYPTGLMYSLDDRVIPRCRVVQLLKSKKLLKKMPNFVSILSLTEKEFLEKYIAVFREDTEEIPMAYKGVGIFSEL
ncbi:Transcription termination factor, mitochondrial/chloroplastic [Dillenia turbinata]|uniref:Transcription termination factor, mitochondrial/chloroplastic n=1 Tax=Dillenia turbinata TaxID=194707 RepID=A0AAN8Z343_9MAGN